MFYLDAAVSVSRGIVCSAEQLISTDSLCIFQYRASSFLPAHLILSLFVTVQPKKTSKRREPIRASTAGEAIEKMLEQKKISSKINYDVLRDLNSKGSSSPAHKTEEVSGIVPGRKKLTRRKKQPNKSNLGLAKPASLMGKR